MVDLQKPVAFTSGTVRFWWQRGLIGVATISAGIGLIVFFVWIIQTIRQRLKKKHNDSFVPKPVADRFLISSSTLGRQDNVSRGAKPTSFGVYLGTFESVPSAQEIEVLSRYELIILNPSQRGVQEVLLNSDIRLSPRVVARLDVRQFAVDGRGGRNDTDMLQVAERIIRWTTEVADVRRGNKCVFTGVTIAGWHGTIETALLNAIGRYTSELGFETYLEVVPPSFLEDTIKPDMQLFDGLVVKNGTVLPNGQVRDFFQMEKIKSTTREFIVQSCMRDFTVMIWDPVDDRIQVSHAVVKRSFTWCSYHGAVVWIGPESSLTNASTNMPIQEPLAAFHWLKENKIVDAHGAYRTTRLLCSRSPKNTADFEKLEPILPSMRSLVDSLSSNNSHSSSLSDVVLHRRNHYNSQPKCGSEDTTLFDSTNGTEWVAGINKSAADPLSISATGINYTGFGCFSIGLEVTGDAFAEVVKSQRRLRRLNLLTSLEPEKLRDMARPLQRYISALPTNSQGSLAARGIHELSELLAKASDVDQFSDPVQIYLGLDSGFHGSANSQFWAVYETDRRSGGFVIYVSKNTCDILGAVVHAYLSSRALSRYQCFLAELDLSHFLTSSDASTLPDRLMQDLHSLSPTELLLLVQQSNFSTWNPNCPLLSNICIKSEELLIDVPSFQQLKYLGNVRYIEDSISPEDLVRARIDWYKQHGFDSLSEEVAIEVFTDVHFAFRDILHLKLYDQLDALSNALAALVPKKSAGNADICIDPYADLLIFAIFCAARKAAFEEVYIEVSDRNPLFNEFSDQSAAMAELFALGSRCEAYFDVNPSSFGKLLSGRHRAYYSQAQNQPPMWIHNAPAFCTAYAAAATDIDPNDSVVGMPGFRRFTFLSVFAIPALVDIVLLTYTGRGLYLSANMTEVEGKYATLALMLSLLLSGAVGTWISIGGTYYLISMAFSAANVFVLTRLVAGLAFTLVFGVIGFVAITVVETSHYGGIVFFLYLVGLTAYLSVLAALSTFQFPGSAFLNGRKIIIGVIPALLISPILTEFIHGHDIYIYLIFLYVFIGLLVFGLRHVGASWVTWITKIKTVDDAGVKAWYVENRAGGRADAFEGMTAPAAMTLSRTSLDAAVKHERLRPFWKRSKADKLVQQLAGCWEATDFLLNWYCRISNAKRPMPYTSTWNIEVRVAYDSLQQNQKGIKLHNSFVHWRNAGDEIVCGILYFIVALLDRWIELIYGGGHLVGLTTDDSYALRLAVGLGLAYYLVGAVLLDYKAQHLHSVAQEMTPVTIQTKEYIRAAEIYDAKVKQKLYWTTLLRFLGVHVWALSLTSCLLWVFDAAEELAFITFLSYAAAYTGLLLYQYNKIFSGPHVLGPLVIALVIGIPVGLILKKFNGDFAYNNVITLGLATWTAALLSIRTAKIGMPPKPSIQTEKTRTVFHAYGGLGIDQKWSQTELEAFYEAVMTDLKREAYEIVPTDHPGTEIRALLLSCNDDTLSLLAMEAYPEVRDMMERITNAWERGSIKVTLVNMHSIIPVDADVRALSYYTGGRLHILVQSDSEISTAERPNMSSNSRVIAETLIHAASEAFFGLTHEHVFSTTHCHCLD